MRGGGRAGGRSFRVPRSVGVPNSADPFFPEIVPIGDLPIAPVLVPINDEWSISNFDDPVNEKDCAAYPASPYCDGDILSLKPIGYEYEIRTNGCETCLYIYPVVLFFKAQPVIICHSDPNCKRFAPPRTDRQPTPRIPYIPKGFKLATTIFRSRDRSGAKIPGPLPEFQVPEFGSNFDRISSYTDYRFGVWGASGIVDLYGWIDNYVLIQQGYGFPDVTTEDDLLFYLNAFLKRTTGTGNEWGLVIGANDPLYKDSLYADWYWGFEFALVPIKGGDKIRIDPPPPPLPPPPPPPPPPPDDNDGGGNDGDDNDGRKKRRRRRKPVCCNACNDAADNTAKLLKELKAIRKILGTGSLKKKTLETAIGLGDDSITGIVSDLHRRLGVENYPITVPNSLIEGVGDKEMKLQSNAEFLTWLTYQIDGMVGQFPVEIEIKDIDPLTEGDQKKTITLPNISESIAEIYGLTIKNSVNQEVELNMLLRMAAEVIATKNATVVTQDYARANANFLGYKANYKPRELTYNFDFTGANLDPKAKEPIVLEKLLKTVTGYVQGWQLEDKETIVGFLQKLMFSAGIIKAVFFRGKAQQKELKREMESMANDEKVQEQKFEAFIKEINDPNSRFNKDSQDKPQMKDETQPETKPKG